MKTLYQTKQLVNEQNQMTLTVEFPFDQCSLARVYDYLDLNFECGGLFDILEIKPLELNKEAETLKLSVVVDISDALEEYPEDENQDEIPEEQTVAVAYACID